MLVVTVMNYRSKLELNERNEWNFSNKTSLRSLKFLIIFYFFLLKKWQVGQNEKILSFQPSNSSEVHYVYHPVNAFHLLQRAANVLPAVLKTFKVRFFIINF